MMTAAETMMKAQSVPILVISATALMGRKPAVMAVMTPTRAELLAGVLYFE